jgi:hypothetical protein
MFFLSAEEFMKLPEREQGTLASTLLHKPYIMQVHAKMLNEAVCALDVRTIWEAGSVVITAADVSGDMMQS